MSQQKPGNPLIQFLLVGAMVFLGMQMFCNKGNGVDPKKDPRKAEEVYAKILEVSKSGDDVALGKEIQIYLAKLEAQKTAGLISQEDLDKKAFEASVIQIEAGYSSALKASDQGKLDNLYNQTFKKLYDQYQSKPLWTTPVPAVPIEGKIEGATVTPEQLYAHMGPDLRAMNKDAKVLGYIPGYKMMDSLVNMTGAKPYFSYWFAALMLAFLVRLAVFPLAQKQFRWGRRMSQLSPYIKEIQEKYKDKKTGQITDQQAMSMETMEVYKKYGFNPFSGCLPLLIQVPLFIIVYRCMLLYKFEFTNGFFLWVNPHAGKFLGIPLASSLGEKDYILIVLYGISMIVTTLLTPVSDPTNIRQQRLIGLAMSVMVSVFMFLFPLPSAFTLYWLFTNILATAQSLYVYRLPVEPLVPVQTTAGGAIPTTGRDMNGRTTAVDPGFFGKTGKSGGKKKK